MNIRWFQKLSIPIPLWICKHLPSLLLHFCIILFIYFYLHFLLVHSNCIPNSNFYSKSNSNLNPNLMVRDSHNNSNRFNYYYHPYYILQDVMCRLSYGFELHLESICKSKFFKQLKFSQAASESAVSLNIHKCNRSFLFRE